MNEFTPIDTKTWPMSQQFHYYSQMAPTTYTVNVDVDVTVLRKVLKEKGYKFFPTYLYLVTRSVNSIDNFRVAIKDGFLGHYKTLTPAYPQFHEDDKTTSLLFTEYNDDYKTFYNSYINDVKNHSNDHGILTSKGIPPANTYVISCIPWFTFNSFSVHNHGIKDYFFPSFEAGGFKECDGKTLMPLSVTVHHATVDGYHLKVLFETLQGLMDNPCEWLK